MEGVFFILIGGALLAQSWYVLGLYSEGRTMGVFVGGLGLLGLATITFTPMLLTGTPATSDALSETTVFKTLVLIWALYCIGVAANGLFDFDERAVGFYAAFLSVATAVPFLDYAIALAPKSRYSDAVWLSLSGATLTLSVLAAIVFFYLAFQFNVLRLVAGWFLLLGSGIIITIGLAIVSTLIS
jgi:hypothetical protein